MKDHALMTYVQDELFWDQKVDSAAIAVSAHDGTITLRGTIGSYREKLDAQADAQRVYGVKKVDNELEVKLLGSERDDYELRADVLQALMLDSIVPSTVDARVYDGLVTLTGTASWQYQRDEAELVASKIAGVLGVYDDITLKPTPTAGDVEERIAEAFKRNAGIGADALTVATSGGTVTLTGEARSWAEHDEAVAAAWAAPGVAHVHDRISVSP